MESDTYIITYYDEHLIIYDKNGIIYYSHNLNLDKTNDFYYVNGYYVLIHNNKGLYVVDLLDLIYYDELYLYPIIEVINSDVNIKIIDSNRSNKTSFIIKFNDEYYLLSSNNIKELQLLNLPNIKIDDIMIDLDNSIYILSDDILYDINGDLIYKLNLYREVNISYSRIGFWNQKLVLLQRVNKRNRIYYNIYVIDQSTNIEIANDEFGYEDIKNTYNYYDEIYFNTEDTVYTLDINTLELRSDNYGVLFEILDINNDDVLYQSLNNTLTLVDKDSVIEVYGNSGALINLPKDIEINLPKDIGSIILRYL